MSLRPKAALFRRGKERRKIDSPPGQSRRRQERRKHGNLSWIPLFRNADEESILAALSQCEVLQLSPGTPLLKPGETNQNVYILLSGQISAHLDVNLNGPAAIPIPPGECIGELSAIDGKPASALVLALSEARVLTLPREIFWKRLMTMPGIAENLMLTLTERMRRTNDLTLQAQREQLELQHLRKELDVARQLQASMLPLQRPLFPDRHEIEVCGFMEPTASVGGDLFDAFFVDDRNVFFCIGDVSGHGIAAALFMARTIGLLRILAMNTLSPEAVLESVNERLCIGNDTNIFVTLFCGYLDVFSGRLRYSNAGHCAPILRCGDQASRLDIPKGALIGVFSGMRYQALEFLLTPTSVLFCFTDGVTEAQNPQGEEFSEERCRDLIAHLGDIPLSAQLETIRQAVAQFCSVTQFEDDCTMLALRRR